jgi:hypothetical protein
MTECGATTKSMDLEITSGLMAGLSKVSGKTTICTVKASTLGQMDESTKANIRMIESMALELMFGLTGDNMRVCGSTVNNMARVYTAIPMGNSAKVSGQKANALLGLRQEKTFLSESAILI